MSPHLSDQLLKKGTSVVSLSLFLWLFHCDKQFLVIHVRLRKLLFEKWSMYMGIAQIAFDPATPSQNILASALKQEIVHLDI